MWRSIVFLALTIAFSLNLLVQGDESTRRFVIVTWAILGSLVAASEWAQRHTEYPVARALLKARGPQTDGPITTKAQGYAAAYSFLRFGLAMLVLFALTVYLLDSVRSARAQTALAMLLPFILLPAGMGLFGGLYLLVRARLTGQPPRGYYSIERLNRGRSKELPDGTELWHPPPRLVLLKRLWRRMRGRT